MKPSSERRALIRSTVWAKAKGVTATDNRLLANTFASATLFKTAIKHANGNFNRAYIMELLEHKVDYSILTGLYPKLSGGPNQRYISTGGYIMRVPKKQDDPLSPISEWITPEKRFTVTEQ